MKFFCTFFLSFASLLILGCSVNYMSKNTDGLMSSVPADFSVEYQWIAGSMPPPYHYEFMIRIKASGQGEVIYWPDYSGGGTPEWKEDFTVTQKQLEQLYQVMESNGLFSEEWQAQERHIVGGSHEFMNVTANGKKIKVPAFVTSEQTERIKTIYASIRAIPPKAIWDKMGAQRQVYMDSYQRGKQR
jgi:hypothetical protein